MSDYNKTILVGNLVADAQLRYLSSGSSVLDFRLASTRGSKGKEQTLFIDCSLFGERGVKVAEFLTKGKKLLVDGVLRLEQWEKDGEKRSKISIMVDNVEFLSSGERQEKTEPVVQEQKVYDTSYIDVDQTVPF
jgi:single-strand DNA-binding protein